MAGMPWMRKTLAVELFTAPSAGGQILWQKLPVLYFGMAMASVVTPCRSA